MPPKGIGITVARKTGAAALAKRMLGLGKLAAYVGVPASTSKERSAQLLKMAGATRGKRKKARLEKAATSDINNAELLYVFSKGSPKRGQPARPLLEPAIGAEGNRQKIARETVGAVKATLAGDREKAIKQMKRAALAGQNAARSWITDPRNSWAPNTPGTIRAKGSDIPGIDTGAMRASIIGIVAEE